MPQLKVASLALVLLLLAGCVGVERQRLVREATALQQTSLQAIGSPDELDQILLASESLAEREAALARAERCQADPAGCPPVRRRAKGPVIVQEVAELETISVTGSAIRASDTITNNQESGVDEGDIVKKSGDFILVLRGSALHSVRIARQGRPVLELADRLVLVPPGEEDDIWFDEILTVGSRVLLLGFNYGGGEDVAELMLFSIDANGRLARTGRYWLRTQDYFDGTNYGARIQGDNLLLSLSLPLERQGDMAWPEWSRRDVPAPTWTPLVEASELFYPVILDGEPYLHLVLQCPVDGLDGFGLDCRGTGIVGTGDATLYASANHAYLAMSGWDPAGFGTDGLLSARSSETGDYWKLAQQFQRSAILRIPYAASTRPAFAMIPGTVRDQFNFHESADGSLFLAAAQPGQDEGQLLLVRLRPEDFADRAAPLPAPVATVAADRFCAKLRFSGRMLWVGNRCEDRFDPTGSSLMAQPLAGGRATSVRLGHRVAMLQPLFGDLLAVGADQDGRVGLSLVKEAGTTSLRSALVLADREMAESRSHALNFVERPDGGRWLALPVMSTDPQVSSDARGEQLADMQFLRIEQGRLVSAGLLDMNKGVAPPCEDCWDWYGAARPFFVGPRLFALSGGLMMEAVTEGLSIRELRRVELP